MNSGLPSRMFGMYNGRPLKDACKIIRTKDSPKYCLSRVLDVQARISALEFCKSLVSVNANTEQNKFFFIIFFIH